MNEPARLPPPEHEYEFVITFTSGRRLRHIVNELDSTTAIATVRSRYAIDYIDSIKLIAVDGQGK